MTDTYNIARGRYVDPSVNSLYQMVDYPEVRIDSLDGIERVTTINLPYVEDGRRAQRIAKQVLQRNQYRGTLSAVFLTKALGCAVGDVVRLTFSPLGWSNKLFRVISQEIRFDGMVPMTLVEENAAIYAWDAEDSTPVTPTAPTIYNPLNHPFINATEAETPRHDYANISLAFAANYQGVLSAGQLPKTVQIKRLRGSIDLSTDATWSIVSQGSISGGTVTVTSGVVTIPDTVTIPPATEIIVSSTLDGFQIVSRIAIARNDGTVPVIGGGVNTVSDNTFDSVTGTTLVAISDIMTVTTGSTGQIDFAAPLGIIADASTPTGSFGAVMQWKYRPIAGSFSDAGTQADELSQSVVYYDSELGFYSNDQGYIDATATVTGLTADTEYEVQLWAARDSASPSKTLYFVGTASVTGS